MDRCILYLHLLVSSFLLCTFLLSSAQATKKCYIVYLGAHSHGPNPSSYDLESATNSHYDLLSSTLGSHEKAKEAIIYSYNKHINGFAALLEEEEAAQIAKKENVVSVFLSKEHKPQTTRSWEFLGLRRNGINTAWQIGRYGENTIIANIDTGVWPESESFSEKGIGPVPAKWRGGNVCQISKLGGSNKTPCNRKLIGARFFSKAYEASIGSIPPSQHTARDFQGHGTHTLSTAGGNFVPGATVLGNANGTAKGGSPRARVAAYKVCWSTIDETSCLGADVLAAIDQAIADAVDVISVSAGSTRTEINSDEIFTDEVSIGAFHALFRNVVLVASAGNDGPTPETVVNVAPWLFTVAASTIDRDFSSNITLGNNQVLTGASLFVNLPSNQSFPLILASDARFANATIEDAQVCKPGTLDPAKVSGKIVMCLRGGKIRSVAEGQEALSAGAVGMVLENDDQSGNTVIAEPHVLSTTNTHKTNEGKNVYDYYNSTESPIVSMSAAKTLLGIKPAPVMASFSSRGPNPIQPSILKPDITASGVNILASYSLAASLSNLPSDTRRGFRFNVLQGTSMSCPHVSGVAGLLKTRHPNWTPAAIKSAIMTTATTQDNTNGAIQDADNTLATPFAYGSGHVQPDLAMDPGLVYDITIFDYLNLLCASGYSENLIASLIFNKTFICYGSHRVTDLNYPSITLPNIGSNAENVTRTVTNVGPPSTYVANAELPGFNIVVVPSSLTFKRVGEKKRFQVIVEATSESPKGSYQFGELKWTNGNHVVRSPIVVRLTSSELRSAY